MAEKGVFRTCFMGGFNKKDVLKFFEELQKEKTQESFKALEENVKLKEKVEELLNAIEAYDQKQKELEQQIEQLTEENNKNSELESALFEANKALEENQDFKARFEELSRKILKIKSDYIIKESEYKKLETKYSALKSAVDLLPKMSESDFAKARESLDEITNVINELQKLHYSIDRIKD